MSIVEQQQQQIDHWYAVITSEGVRTSVIVSAFQLSVGNCSSTTSSKSDVAIFPATQGWANNSRWPIRVSRFPELRY